MRIQKYLSSKGVCSRREAEDFILRGLVTVNGKIVREMGVKIDPETDRVELNSAGIKDKKESVAIYKPKGIVSSRISSEGKTIYDLFPQFFKLNIAGRLDKESEGLLLLSNDGVVARAVTGDGHITEKEYEVVVREKINVSQITRLFERGAELSSGRRSAKGGKDEKTLPAKVKVLNNHVFRVILKEGEKHQIRRMCEYIRLTVVKLKRIRIGDILLGNLGAGDYRFLGDQEVKKFREVRAKNNNGVIS